MTQVLDESTRIHAGRHGGAILSSAGPAIAGQPSEGGETLYNGIRLPPP